MLLILISIVAVLMYATIAQRNRQRHPVKDFRQRLEKKIQEHRTKRSETSNPAMEPTPTRVASRRATRRGVHVSDDYYTLIWSPCSQTLWANVYVVA